ncbi:MAG: isoprenylcysteine carboxylmethyltransferase family protein [Chloroflexota bacterium]
MREERGAAWVAAQMPLELLVAVCGWLGPRLPKRGRARRRRVGLAVMLSGLAGLAWSGATLGRNLTPFPRPRQDGELVVTGPFGLTRHPIYTFNVVAAIGYGLFRDRLLVLLATVPLAVVLWYKAGAEERWLSRQFPQYATYRTRVRRLLPGVC